MPHGTGHSGQMGSFGPDTGGWGDHIASYCALLPRVPTGELLLGMCGPPLSLVGMFERHTYQSVICPGGPISLCWVNLLKE